MNKHYKLSPIIEAVCEFRYDPIFPWDSTIPGFLYEKIKGKFPKKGKLVYNELKVNPDTKGGLQQQFTIIERTQFLREDEKLFVQVSENFLAFNKLKPYSSWSEFYQIIQEISKIYFELSNPKGFQRIGLRFINQIEFPTISSELKDYFNLYPKIGEKLPQKLESLMMGITFVFENGRDIARVVLANTKVEKEKLAFILDIDYFLNKPGAIVLEKAQDWVNNAHTQVENIFEEALTNTTKKLFE